MSKLLRLPDPGMQVVFVHSCLDDAGLTQCEYRVYGHLARRAGSGVAFPGLRSMAEICRADIKSVSKAIAGLEARRMIRRKRTPGQTTEYYLTPASDWLGVVSNGVGSNGRGGVVSNGGGGVGNDTTKGNPVKVIQDKVPPIVPQGGQEQGERANEPAQQAEPVKAKPKRERKPRGERKPRPDDALMDALAALGGCNPRETPRSRWSAIARCKWDLVEVCPDLTPAEIDRRATNYRTHFEGAALTPEALTKHWARCAEPKRGLTLVRPEPVLRFV